jgi:MinD-like ATPase involved in chromosome partitioning or flagellar assembly
MMRKHSGQIITFYSYKGGTGRTMALSNLAWVLASNGHDVLLIDWDLEAPGLHRYLRYFLVDPELSATPGLIDYVWEAARVSMTPANGEGSRARYPALEDYVVGLDWDFANGGSIAFLPAGRQDANYAQRVNTFDWDDFYARLGGGRLLQAERKALKAAYDFVLIDSRTGVSDTSSICTVQMPDQLVVLFTLNWQSIRGGAAVSASVQAQRGDSLPIFPVPSRIEEGETDKRDAALAYAQKRFARFLERVQPYPGTPDPRAQSHYWLDVKTSYKTYYAFEEVPAAFKDTPGDHGSILAATERLASWLTDRHVTRLRIDGDDERRDAVVAGYTFVEDGPVAAPIPGRLAPRRYILARVAGFARRRITPHFWQYLMAVLFGLVAVYALGQWLEEGRTNSRLQAKVALLQAEVALHQRASDAVRVALERSLDDLKAFNIKAPYDKVKVDDLSNQLSNALKLIESFVQVVAPRTIKPGNYRVFVQFAGVLRREDVRTMMESLHKAGWNVQGVEGGGERTTAAAGQNEIRYGNEADASAAQALADVVQGTRIVSKKISIKHNPNLETGTLEVWISQ